MKSNNRYLNIRDMSQLKTERAKLDSTIKMKEELFNIHYSKLIDSIRISNLISSAVTRVSIMIPLIVKTTRTLKNLYHFILSQFKSEKQESNNSLENCGSQEENDQNRTID